MPYHNMQTAWFASRIVFICHFLDSLVRWLNDFSWDEHDVPIVFLFQMMSVYFILDLVSPYSGLNLRLWESFLSKCKPYLMILFTESLFFIRNNQLSVIQHLIHYHLHQTTTLLIILLQAPQAHIIKPLPLFHHLLLLGLSVLVAVATWNMVNFVVITIKHSIVLKEKGLLLCKTFP